MFSNRDAETFGRRRKRSLLIFFSW